MSWHCSSISFLREFFFLAMKVEFLLFLSYPYFPQWCMHEAIFSSLSFVFILLFEETFVQVQAPQQRAPGPRSQPVSVGPHLDHIPKDWCQIRSYSQGPHGHEFWGTLINPVSCIPQSSPFWSVPVWQHSVHPQCCATDNQEEWFLALQGRPCPRRQSLLILLSQSLAAMNLLSVSTHLSRLSLFPSVCLCICLCSITDAMDMDLGELREMVRDGEAWHAAVHRPAKSCKEVT